MIRKHINLTWILVVMNALTMKVESWLRTHGHSWLLIVILQLMLSTPTHYIILLHPYSI